MVKYLSAATKSEKRSPKLPGRLRTFTDSQSFEKTFEKSTRRYVDALLVRYRSRAIFVLFAILLRKCVHDLQLSERDFFPTARRGQFRLHVNAPPGTPTRRESEQDFSRVADVIRESLQREISQRDDGHHRHPQS